MPVHLSPAALAKLLPDDPRWVHARSLLLAGQCTVFNGDEEGYVIIGCRLGVIVGEPEIRAIIAAMKSVPHDFELLVPMESAARLTNILWRWKAEPAMLHTRRVSGAATPNGQVDPREIELLSPQQLTVNEAPLEFQDSISGASVIAAKRIESNIVSMCCAGSITETWWDVDIGTVEQYRRQGYARACFAALDQYFQRLGKRPVWGATESNIASRAMALGLGFHQVDEILVMNPPTS